MAIPSSITDLSTTAASNFPQGSDAIGNPGTIDDYFRAYGAIQRAESLNKSWERWYDTPTYISATQFSVAGNLTSRYTVNRRVKCSVTAGTVYGYISASAYSSVTTVTVVLDSGSLDSGLSEVQLGPENNAALKNVRTTGTLNVNSGDIVKDANGDIQLAGTYTYPAKIYVGTGNITTASGKPSYGIAQYQTVVGLDAGQAYCANNAEQTINNVGSLNHVIGYQTYLRNSSTTTDFYSFGSYLLQTGGTSTNGYGFFHADAIGAGTITNQYGVYIADLTKGATSNYAVYTAGSTKSYFGGYVGFGVVPTFRVDVGDGTTTEVVRLNGAGSGVNGGGVMAVYNNGSQKISIGNYSAIFGGAYNANGVVYSAGSLYLTPNATAASSTVIDTSGNITVAGAINQMATASATAQTANIAKTNIYTTTATGWYRVTVQMVVTRAATTSGTPGQCGIHWTDPDSSTEDRVGGFGASDLATNTVGYRFIADYMAYAKTGTNISYSTTNYTSSGATSLQFAVRATVHRMA